MLRHKNTAKLTLHTFKCWQNPTGTSQTNLSVRIQRVQHRGRRQEVPVTQIFSAALLEPQLLRFWEYPVAVFPSGFGHIVTLSPQCGAQRPDGRGDPEGRRLLDILHHHHNTNRWGHCEAINTSTPCTYPPVLTQAVLSFNAVELHASLQPCG